MTMKNIRRSRCKRALLSLLALVLSFLIAGCDPLTMLAGSRFIGQMSSDGTDLSRLENKEQVIDYSNVSLLRVVTEDAFATMVQQYLVAQMATEQARRAAESGDDPQAFVVAMDRASEAWREYKHLQQRTIRLANLLTKQEEKEAEKKVSYLFPAPLFSSACAASDAELREKYSIQNCYENFQAGKNIAILAPELGKSHEEVTNDIMKWQTQRDAYLKDKEEQEKTNKKTKLLAIAGGITLIPVGIGVGLGGASTVGGIGVAEGVVKVTATMSGALSTAMGVGFDLKDKPMDESEKKMKFWVDTVSVTSGIANIGFGIKNAKDTVQQTMKEKPWLENYGLAQMTAEQYVKDMGAVGTVLFANDAKSMKDYLYDVGKKGYEYYLTWTEDGQPCAVLKKMPPKEPEVKSVYALDKDQLNAEIKERQKIVNEARKTQAQLLDESLDWEYKNSMNMTSQQYYDKCAELEDKIERAKEEEKRAREEAEAETNPDRKAALDKRVDAASQNVSQAYQDWSDFTKPHRDYVGSQAYKDEEERREKELAKAEEKMKKAIDEEAVLNTRRNQVEQRENIKQIYEGDKNRKNAYPADKVAGVYMGTGFFKDTVHGLGSESWQESVTITPSGELSLTLTFHDYAHPDQPDWVTQADYNPDNGAGWVEGFDFLFTEENGKYIFNFKMESGADGMTGGVVFGKFDDGTYSSLPNTFQQNVKDLMEQENYAKEQAQRAREAGEALGGTFSSKAYEEMGISK